MAIITICSILAQTLFCADGQTAYELYSIGLQHELEGNIPAAIEYYENALTRDPGEPDIYISLANAYYQIRTFDRGIAIARAGLNIAPQDPDLLEIIAIGYLGKGDLRKAAKAYHTLHAMYPDQVEYHKSLSIIYEGMEDFTAAQEILLEIPDTLKTADTYIQLGLLAGKAKNHGKALEYYYRAHALEPLNTTALIGVGTGYDILNVKDSAICYYEQALDDDSLYMTIGRRLIDLYTDTDKYERVMPIARKVLTIAPEDVYTRRSLGYAYYKTGSFDKAIQEFMLASRIDPDDVYSRFYMGRVYLENQEYKNALREISRAIEINPDFIELWIYLAFVALDTRDYELARNALHEAAHRGGDVLQIFYLLGVTYEMEGNDRDAYRYYHKALDVDPADAPSLDALANLAARMDRDDDAFRMFARIIEIDSTNATALNYVGYTLADRNKRLDYALDLIDRALVLEPHNPYFLDSRGWVLYRMGQYQDALKELQRAADITEDAVILEHLGDVYVILEQPGHARNAYERAFELDPSNTAIQKKLQQLPE